MLHVDLDAFYVSMELLRRPELRGLPVAVGGGPGPRGVLTTCSYEARKFGVRSAMPASQALRLCPKLIFLPVDFAYYAVASKQFHGILSDFTPAVEPGGADEAYLDVSGCERLFGPPDVIAKAIRARVREEIGIAASVGASTSRLVSKVGSDAAKPDGMLVVPPGGEAAFLAPRAIRDLPGIGPKTAEQLATLGVRTIGDLQALPVEVLALRFGNSGHDLHLRSLGQDVSRVHYGREGAKSISRETTFEYDEPSRDRLRAVLRGQAERVAADLGRQGRAARTVTLKLRFPPFETLTRSETQSTPLDLADEVFAAGASMFERAWEENSRRPVRLLGVGVANLVERARQLRFGEVREADRLERTVADLRGRFGDAVLRRAAEIRTHTRD
ncbi:hypothetical protein AYO38_11700 [bacterium SCGC AG-212-C10]|nr:hypothetical protein AYO38_11700 [bacterium SCGC AG-212-C10]